MVYRFAARGAAAAIVLWALAPLGHAQDDGGKERCYGVAKAGQNQGIDTRTAPGSSTVDYQGNAWVQVPAGTCSRITLPVQPDGTPRRGAIQPLDRDRP